MKTIFLDIDTQIDFLFPAGALYVPGAEKIIPALAELNRLAPWLISTVDAHTENDPEFSFWPPHCVAGTVGQRKPNTTLVGAKQTLFEKQTLDAFADGRLGGMLGEMAVERYVVYGVVTEICVRHAAWGLLKTGKRVELVTDAVRSLDEGASRKTLAEFEALGGHLTTLSALLGV